MLPRPLALSSLLLLAGAGCAAKYVPSERMQSLRRTMDPAEAANRFASALGRSPAGQGLCKAPFGFDDPRATTTLDAFTVQAWKAGKETGRRQEGGRTVISYEKVRYAEERAYRDVRKIRVTQDARGMCAGPALPGQAAVLLHFGGIAIPYVVAVATDSIDDVLAAISVLAPQAELVEGAGL